MRLNTGRVQPSNNDVKPSGLAIFPAARIRQLAVVPDSNFKVFSRRGASWPRSEGTQPWRIIATNHVRSISVHCCQVPHALSYLPYSTYRRSHSPLGTEIDGLGTCSAP